MSKFVVIVFPSEETIPEAIHALLVDISGSASLGLEPGGAAGLGELAHPENVALPLGHRDHTARVEKVEDVARLDALVVGGQGHQVATVRGAPLEQRPAFGFRVLEMLEQDRIKAGRTARRTIARVIRGARNG